MVAMSKFIKQKLLLIFMLFLIYISGFAEIYADEISWTEVANNSNEIQLIDASSIKYNNTGLLSVVTKFTELTPENQAFTNTKSYLMVIDCENRLFSKLPINGDLKQVKQRIFEFNLALNSLLIINVSYNVSKPSNTNALSSCKSLKYEIGSPFIIVKIEFNFP